jgi:hypothetical protein
MKNINSFGFELELFCKQDGAYVEPENLPVDSCGYLVECRAEPHAKPLDAMYLMKAELERITAKATEEGYELELAATADIPREFLRQALRRHGKSQAHSFFAYGGAYRNTKPRAGLHLHFGTTTKVKAIGGSGENEYEYEKSITQIANIPRVLWILDMAFKDEIIAAKRVRGEYEIKEHGFEYRSLPANIDLNKVVTVLNQINKEYD